MVQVSQEKLVPLVLPGQMPTQAADRQRLVHHSHIHLLLHLWSQESGTPPLPLGWVSVWISVRVFALSPGAVFSNVCGKVCMEGKESEEAE